MMTILSRILPFLIAVLIHIGLILPSYAQTERITITEGTVEPTPIAIADFTDQTGRPGALGRMIAEIISNDLEGSGMFRPEASASLIPPPRTPSIKPDFSEWTPLGIKALLVGSAQESGNGMIEVVFILWDVVTEREIIAGEGEVSEQDYAVLRIRSLISCLKVGQGTQDILTRVLSMLMKAAHLNTASNGWQLWIKMAITIHI